MLQALNRLHGATGPNLYPAVGETGDKQGAAQHQGHYPNNTEKPESFGLHLRYRSDNWGTHLNLGGDGEFRVVY